MATPRNSPANTSRRFISPPVTDMMCCSTAQMILNREYDRQPKDRTVVGEFQAPTGPREEHPMKIRITLFASLVAALLWTTGPVQGQAGAKNGEWPTYGGDLGQHALRAARSDHRGELQQAGGRLAFQDRESRAPAGIQFRVDAAHGQRQGVSRRLARVAPSWRWTGPRVSCSGCTANRKASAARRRLGSFRVEASRTGPTAARSGFFMSRPAIA